MSWINGVSRLLLNVKDVYSVHEYDEVLMYTEEQADALFMGYVCVLVGR